VCYHKQDRALEKNLVERYKATMHDAYEPRFYESGFSHLSSPAITSENPSSFRSLSWGLIPFWIKTMEDALQIRDRTLNCISEEAFDKPSFRNAIRERRCLIPCTGFYEWRWLDGGKRKYPYFIQTDDFIFSLAGIWSEWTDRTTGETLSTYSVLTTRANALMEKVHNHKKRMPVILPQEFEKDWLNPNLTKEDVLALCQPYDDKKMKAWTISKSISAKTGPKNIEHIFQPFEYPELSLIDG